MSFSPGASCCGASSSSCSASSSAPEESAFSIRSPDRPESSDGPPPPLFCLRPGRAVHMRILHTADWHVGKVLKGRSRIDEHTAVLGEIVDIARAEDVDVVIVAGDVFDAAAPVPAAQSLVMRTLLALREDDRQVIVFAGNHDNPHLLDVYRPVLGTVGI